MQNKNLMVGTFVLAGLVLFMAGLFLIGNRHEAFARHIDYYADFTNLAGLSKGSKVQVAGMDAGQVLDVAVPASPQARFRVKCASARTSRDSFAPTHLLPSARRELSGRRFFSFIPEAQKHPRQRRFSCFRARSRSISPTCSIKGRAWSPMWMAPSRTRMGF